jgi:hypothetical protein
MGAFKVIFRVLAMLLPLLQLMSCNSKTKASGTISFAEEPRVSPSVSPTASPENQAVTHQSSSPQQEAVQDKIPECTSDGQVGCVTTEAFKAAEMKSLASKVIAGQVVAGATGLALAESHLPCSGSGTVDCVTTATYKSADWTNPPPCRYGVKATCEADRACRWTAGACEVNPWNIRAGVTLAGKTGFLDFYNNMANTAIFDRVSSPGSVVGLDIYDTIDDYNGDGLTFPTQFPAGLSPATGANWTYLGTEGHYKDEITNLTWYKDDGTVRTWEEAISYCEGLTTDVRSDWHLPTEKELLQAYINGIWSQKDNLTIPLPQHWSASSVSYADAGWIVYLDCGYTYNDFKTAQLAVICVAR